MEMLQSLLAGRQSLFADHAAKARNLGQLTTKANSQNEVGQAASNISGARALATRIQHTQAEASISTGNGVEDLAKGSHALAKGTPPPPRDEQNGFAPATVTMLSQEAEVYMRSEREAVSGTLGRGEKNLTDSFNALEEKMTAFFERAGLSSEMAKTEAGKIADSARSAYDKGYKADIGFTLTQAEIQETAYIATNAAGSVVESDVDVSGYLATAQVTLSVDPSTGGFSATFSQTEMTFEHSLTEVAEEGWMPLDGLGQNGGNPPPLLGQNSPFKSIAGGNDLFKQLEEFREQLRTEFEEQVAEDLALKGGASDLSDETEIDLAASIKPGDILIRGLENGQGAQTETGALALKAEIALVVSALDMPLGMSPLGSNSGGSFGGGAFGAHQASNTYQVNAYANHSSQKAVGFYA